MNHLVGAAAALIGFSIGVACLGLSAKPDNVSFSLDPSEALSTCFFSFAWVGGDSGLVFGAALLLAYLAAWYCLGVKFYRRFVNSKR
ncbi:MAG: hypothetical protein Q4P24_12390 [Rhodobacterales bacterium]|nr:hypothetical protein [Rhodobacterales bacterium]